MGKDSHRLRRITVDIDFKNPFRVAFYLFRCLKYLNNKQGEMLTIKCSSKKGFHFFLWTRSSGDKFKIKNYLGNDKHQTRLDKMHRYGRQTLFNKKIKFKKSKYKIK